MSSVRQAVAYAINRAALNSVYAFGQATPTSQFLSVELLGITIRAAANTFAYNPAKAKALLKQPATPMA